MISKIDKNTDRKRRHSRVRAKISGTAACPRLCVYRSLNNIYAQIIDDVKGNIHKIQIAFNGEFPEDLSKKIDILHRSEFGSVVTLIAKGGAEKLKETISAYKPLILDILPLTLEEVFIYELGGMGYEFENIIL